MPSTKAKAAVKSKSKSKKFFYYRIFDDNENKNYLKSVLTHKQVERYLKAFEKTHQNILILNLLNIFASMIIKSK